MGSHTAHAHSRPAWAAPERAVALGAAVLPRRRVLARSRLRRRQAPSRSRASTRVRAHYQQPSPASFNKANQQLRPGLRSSSARPNARLKQVNKADGRRPGAVRGGAQAGSCRSPTPPTRTLGSTVAGRPAHLQRPEPDPRRGRRSSCRSPARGTWSPRRSSPTPASSPPVQQEQQHTPAGHRASWRGQRKTTKDHISSLLAKQKLDTQLADRRAADRGGAGGPVQRRRRHHPLHLQPGRRGSAGGHRRGLRLQAARLPLPSYGSTGPCSVGFDCSGLIDGGLGGGGPSRFRGIPTASGRRCRTSPSPRSSPATLLYYKRHRPRRDVRRRRHDHRTRPSAGPAGPRAQHEVPPGTRTASTALQRP